MASLYATLIFTFFLTSIYHAQLAGWMAALRKVAFILWKKIPESLRTANKAKDTQGMLL
jgi:hypothetical protein